MRNQVLHAELADVRQQLRRLQKQTANAKRKKQEGCCDMVRAGDARLPARPAWWSWNTAVVLLT